VSGGMKKVAMAGAMGLIFMEPPPAVIRIRLLD